MPRRESTQTPFPVGLPPPSATDGKDEAGPRPGGGCSTALLGPLQWAAVGVARTAGPAYVEPPETHPKSEGRRPAAPPGGRRCLHVLVEEKGNRWDRGQGAKLLEVDRILEGTATITLMARPLAVCQLSQPRTSMQCQTALSALGSLPTRIPARRAGDVGFKSTAPRNREHNLLQVAGEF